PFEAASVLPDVEKRVARKVLGGGRVVHDPQHETVHAQMMARVEHLHGGSVAGGDALYEPVIGIVVLLLGVIGGKLWKRRTIVHMPPPCGVHSPPHCAAMRLLKASISPSSRASSR